MKYYTGSLILILVLSSFPTTTNSSAYERQAISSKDLVDNTYNLIKYGHHKVRNKKYIERLVWEATLVTASKGNRWLSPQDLIGIAIGESDLQWWTVTGKNWLPDCGIMQNHTPLYARYLSERKKLCRLLQKSTWMSFIYGVEELNRYRNKYCLNPKSRHYVKRPIFKKGNNIWEFKKRFRIYKRNLYKCILTLYNQGPNSNWKYNKYWLRSLCFINSVEKGKYPNFSCRKIRYIWQLDNWIKVH